MATDLSFWITSERLEQHFSISDVILGEGNFGMVLRGSTKDATPKDVAVKIIQKAILEDRSDFEREVSMMTSIEHPHVLRLHHVYDEPERLCMVMELVSGGPLFDDIMERGRYSEREASGFARQLSSALASLHAKGIIHRDVNPGNIVLAYEREADSSEMPPVKLCDFGVAHLISDTRLMRQVWGTPGYLAPEVLRGHADSEAPDLWSLGVILYVMLCGGPPFPIPEDDPDEDYQTLESGGFDCLNFPSPQWDGISSAAISMVTALLTTDPSRRLTALGALQHAWLRGVEDRPASRKRRSMMPSPMKALQAVGSAMTMMKSAVLASRHTGVIGQSVITGDAEVAGGPPTSPARAPLGSTQANVAHASATGSGRPRVV